MTQAARLLNATPWPRPQLLRHSAAAGGPAVCAGAAVAAAAQRGGQFQPRCQGFPSQMPCRAACTHTFREGAVQLGTVLNSSINMTEATDSMSCQGPGLVIAT